MVVGPKHVVAVTREKEKEDCYVEGNSGINYLIIRTQHDANHHSNHNQ
jgi:hypothetical protein